MNEPQPDSSLVKQHPIGVPAGQSMIGWEHYRTPEERSRARIRDEFLRDLRSDSYYGVVRIALFCLCIATVVAAVYTWWPWERGVTEFHQRFEVYHPRKAVIIGFAIAGIWFVGALIRAFLDRCDLALRREQRGEQK